MNNTKELPQAIIDAANKCRESVAELDKAIWYPPCETDEVKKLKDDNGCLLFMVIAFGLIAGVSMMFHASNLMDNSKTYKALYEFERDHKVKPRIDNMMISYNNQMVKSLEREVEDLKDDLKFEKGMSSGNKLLYQACMSTK